MEHDARLDILCCLTEGEPRLAVEQVSGKTGMTPRRAKHHMQILGTFDLVGTKREGECGQLLYSACLDDHPEWVREAIEAHREPRGDQSGERW